MRLLFTAIPLANQTQRTLAKNRKKGIQSVATKTPSITIKNQPLRSCTVINFSFKQFVHYDLKFGGEFSRPQVLSNNLNRTVFTNAQFHIVIDIAVNFV